MRIPSRYLSFALIGLLLILVCAVPTSYYCMMPGRVWDLGEMVEGGAYKGSGKFYMTTVSLVKASPVLYVYGRLHPFVDVMPRGNVIPTGWTEEEYDFYTRYLMQQSHNYAKLAVARTAGLKYTEVSQGAYILRVLDDGAAAGKLQPGDVIVNADGYNISFAEDLVQVIRKKQPGDEVVLTVHRDGKKVVCRVVLGEDAKEPGRALLGVGPVLNHEWRVELEPDLTIGTGSVAGPSAGLMLALELLNRVMPSDLTNGLDIAGTGTIDAHGRVGKIGGVIQKLRTAEKADVDAFLLPYENWLEIKDRQIGTRLRLIPVNSLQEALSELYLLQKTASSQNNRWRGVILTSPALAAAWIPQCVDIGSSAVQQP